MDHDEVVRQKLTERYLLHELNDEARDAFEEHYFECSECALDVRAGSEFVENSKIILALPSEVSARARLAPAKPVSQGWFAAGWFGHDWFGHGWFGWLRPGYAAAALALLIAVVGYQNLVTLPRLHGMLHQPADTSVGRGGSRDLGLVRADDSGGAGQRLPAVCQDPARRDLYTLHCGLV